MDYNLIILRGLPGAGKSELSKLLSGGKDELVCEADHYMVDSNGDYDFNPKNLGYSHGRCIAKFESLVNKMEHTIIVSNTSTTITEWKPYRDYAIDNGYNVRVVIVENYHGNKSVHDVPDESMEKMKNRSKINL